MVVPRRSIFGTASLTIALADAVRLENNFELRDVSGAIVVAARDDKTGGKDENHSAIVDRGRFVDRDRDCARANEAS
jgi:hypothetical protein